LILHRTRPFSQEQSASRWLFLTQGTPNLGLSGSPSGTGLFNSLIFRQGVFRLMASILAA